MASGAGCVLIITCAAAFDVYCTAGTTGEDVRRSVRVGKLNLVDLAGSERVHITGATGGQPELASCTLSRCCHDMMPHGNYVLLSLDRHTMLVS